MTEGWREHYTAEQYVKVLQGNIKTLEGNAKRTAGIDYQNGREDERGAVVSFLNFGSFGDQIRKKWVSDIEAKKHLTPSRSKQ